MDEGADTEPSGSARVCRSGKYRDGGYRRGRPGRQDFFRGRCAAWVDDAGDSAVTEHDDDESGEPRRG
ncbi:hypothetical protein MLIT_33410 [Mycolicibacterium litorale]|uniref:Uncharacterized protein n=1 Tax=Mycolicibacterium litorale TaxID=758802 RepID=A0AAD1IMA5_9MYCO|nr:hypothetical protein MLIT_33410 [Mycolicibacterium litorale]